MRLLRELDDERTAQRLADALFDRGIDSEVKPAREGVHLWVHDELQLEEAKQLCQQWLDDGDTAAWEQAAHRGRQQRHDAERQQEQRLRQAERSQRAIEQAATPHATTLTFALIALCVAVFMVTDVADNRAVARTLWIADPGRIQVSLVRIGALSFYWLGLPWDEPWRVLTPIILHADELHIALNMLWLYTLGTRLERVHGSFYMLAFVVLSGGLSNIAQYEIGRSAAFAGMSGVVYGLLGLLWVRAKLDPRMEYGISTITVQFMMLWMALGFLVPNWGSANWCHLGGLLVGAGWGALAAKARRA